MERSRILKLEDAYSRQYVNPSIQSQNQMTVQL